jgi:DNA replication protein DnaC
LILDDFPPRHESETKFARSQFFTLISHRYDDMLKTIITTNKSFESFKGQWSDDAIARRMFPPNGSWVETSKLWDEV